MKLDLAGTGIQFDKETELAETAAAWHRRMRQEELENTGWVRLPENFDQALLNEIKKTAEEIRDKCSLLIVCGVGGSYLGARAVIDALNGSEEGWPEVIFAGFNMSGAYLDKVVKRLQKEATCICAISKSGSTLEPVLAYSILQEKMFDKYGLAARDRIYVITGDNDGLFRKEAVSHGYKCFDVPENIGGRYSVLSVVGLLPIAAAGHDIDELLAGARAMAVDKRWRDELLQYAVARLALQRDGKAVEVFEFFELNFQYFGEWLKQLFGESEGKDGKGAYPTSLCFSRDLHSIGQFLQQGNPVFYETLIRVGYAEYDFEIPDVAGYPYAGSTLETINNCSEEGVVLAHKKDGIPVTTIDIMVLDEYNMGQLIYFFEMSCAVSAFAMGLDPFDQPGVEMYKSEMRRLAEENGKY